jgi:NADPH-dependent ferric siderophore reductase
VGVRRLSPHFTRVTLRCGDFEYFGTECLDQRIKLMFPLADGTLSDLGADDDESHGAGDWYERWRALPEAKRNPFRTYTVRAIDTAECRLDIDFVTHDDGGPAAQWVQAATPGSELVVIGPDARSGHRGVGIDWRPGDARELLLAGDETALPAIASILESLPAGRRARAFVEVPTAEDAIDVAIGEGVTLTWLPRSQTGRASGAGTANGAMLVPAVERWLADNPRIVAAAAATRAQVLDDVDVDLDILWESPEATHPGFYAWIAGESGTVKTLRRLLVRGHGIDRSRVAFMGYWRLGRREN